MLVCRSDRLQRFGTGISVGDSADGFGDLIRQKS